MFDLLKLGDWQGVGGDRFYRLAPDGIAAVKAREQRGLPASSDGRVVIASVPNLADRQAAESWPDALDDSADLPLVTCGAERIDRRKPCEFADLVAAGILVASGPEKLNTNYCGNEIGLRFTLTCSPLELVAWRRAWAAEQRAIAAERKAADLAARVEELESASTEGE